MTSRDARSQELVRRRFVKDDARALMGIIVHVGIGEGQRDIQAH